MSPYAALSRIMETGLPRLYGKTTRNSSEKRSKK